MGSCPGYSPPPEGAVDSAEAVVAPEIPLGPQLTVNHIAGICQPKSREGSPPALRTNWWGIAHLNQHKLSVAWRVLFEDLRPNLFSSKGRTFVRFEHLQPHDGCWNVSSEFRISAGRNSLGNSLSRLPGRITIPCSPSKLLQTNYVMNIAIYAGAVLVAEG